METAARKKGLCVLLLFLLAICLPVRSFARENLQVGYVPGTGFLDEDRPGHMQGYGYEYMEFLSGFLGARFTYVPCINWWEAGAKLERGELDLLPAMPGYYKTLPFAQRTEHVIARFPMELVVQDDFAGGQLKIGTLDYNYPIPSLPKIAQEHGFTYELITFSDSTDMKNAFAKRAIDGYVQPLLHPEKKERVLALFDRVSYRLLIRPGAPKLYTRVNEAQNELLLNQPNIRNRLNDKYGRAKGFPLVLTPAEKAYLQDKKVVHAAVFIRNKPYFYTDDDGSQAGATKALLEQIEKDLDIQIELTETSSSPEEIKRLLTRGTIDLVADVPGDFSWLDNIGLVPTQSYLDIGFVPITKHGAPLPETPRVAAVDGLFETVTFVRSRYPEEQILYCKSWEECCQAVSNGLADVAYVPRATVPYLLEATSAYNLSADTEQVFVSTICLGVAKGEDLRLWQILNKEINHLPPRLLSDALSQGSHEKAHLSPRYLLYHYPLQSALLIFLIMGGISGVIYYRSRSYNRKLTAMEKLACTDSQLQLPNIRYLEHNLDTLLPPGTATQADTTIFTAVFAVHPQDASRLYGRQLQEPLQETARQLAEKDWVLATAAGPVTGELVALCQADSPSKLLSFAAEFVTDLKSANPDYLWQAGLCPLTGKQLSAACEHAAQACQNAYNQRVHTLFWKPESEN